MAFSTLLRTQRVHSEISFVIYSGQSTGWCMPLCFAVCFVVIVERVAQNHYSFWKGLTAAIQDSRSYFSLLIIYTIARDAHKNMPSQSRARVQMMLWGTQINYILDKSHVIIFIINTKGQIIQIYFIWKDCLTWNHVAGYKFHSQPALCHLACILERAVYHLAACSDNNTYCYSSWEINRCSKSFRVMNSGLSLWGGGQGFPPPTKNVDPGYFERKIEEK